MELIPITAIDEPQYVAIKRGKIIPQERLEAFFSCNSTWNNCCPPWLVYFAEEAGQVVGACSFVSAPVDNVVEIKYLTFPTCENNGVGTRMARLLVKMAFAQNEDLNVIVSTRAVVDASTTVVRKLGFRLKKPQRLEAGRHHIWHWIIDKERFAP